MFNHFNQDREVNLCKTRKIKKQLQMYKNLLTKTIFTREKINNFPFIAHEYS